MSMVDEAGVSYGFWAPSNKDIHKPFERKSQNPWSWCRCACSGAWVVL